jgi:hypothetical protein
VLLTGATCVNITLADGGQFLLLLLSACGSTGSGNVVTQTRAVGAFSSIDVGGGVHLELAVDEGGADVAVLGNPGTLSVERSGGAKVNAG